MQATINPKIFQQQKQLSCQVRILKTFEEMLEADREMFLAAASSLREHDDARIELDIYARDQMINAYEREVRRKVFTHLTLNRESSLHAGLVLVSVVIDIERIGDFTKNIVELALHHPNRLVCGPFEDEVRTQLQLADPAAHVVVIDFVHAVVLAPDLAGVPSVLFTHNVETDIFARQVEAHGREGDVAIGISTSGTSVLRSDAPGARLRAAAA